MAKFKFDPNAAFRNIVGFTEENEKRGINTELIRQIPTDMLTDYPEQPFKPYPESKLQELAADIAANGILNPLCVRTQGDKYQILAGHNRRNAAKLAGLTTVPCVIRDVDDDTAAIIVTTTNLNQREKLLPSEKAFAYKIHLEAVKRRTERAEAHLPQVAAKIRSDDLAADKFNISGDTLQRYIRLTYLIPEFLQLVDEEKMSLIAGVNLSYYHHKTQQELLNFMAANNITTVTLKQSEELKAISNLTEERLNQIFGLVEKKTRRAKKVGRVTIKTIEKYFTAEDYSDSEIAEIIDGALRLLKEQGKLRGKNER